MPEAGEYQVRVEGLRFDAAHFATYGGSCEPLHGHSYEVAAEVDGQLSKDSWVIDFTRLKSLLRGICREIDHRMILQCESRLLVIEENGTSWHVATPNGVSYILPAADVAGLPIENSTAECLARWFCERLRDGLAERSAADLSSILVEVWEGPGQRASYKMDACR